MGASVGVGGDDFEVGGGGSTGTDQDWNEVRRATIRLGSSKPSGDPSEDRRRLELAKTLTRRDAQREAFNLVRSVYSAQLLVQGNLRRSD